ncbi:MAG: alpha/beta hydrolase [Acidimicrobiia bacterium]|nr:alpha/beta hydrolase [Acidimicrobiia bacterium]
MSEHRFTVDGNELVGHLAVPPGSTTRGLPALVICHGFPAGTGGGANAARTFPELADRLANEMGWVALCFTYRGCGRSEGDFSMGGWLRDTGAAVAELHDHPKVGGVWAAGFGTGGALSICASAADPRVKGVVALGAPADFDDWASHPRRLLDHAREQAAISDPSFPPSLDQWSRELREIRAVAAAAELAPRPLLVVHGSEDDLVPVFDARVNSDAHGAADLRIIQGAGHQLRHDPRAIAVLLGWLDRQRHLRGGTRVAAGPIPSA